MQPRHSDPPRSPKSIDEAVQRFVEDSAAYGCRIIHQGGGTCLDDQESALAAQRDGIQPARGPMWGTEGETGAWRDKVAAGGTLCGGCRAKRALEGAYFPPAGSKDYHV